MTSKTTVHSVTSVRDAGRAFLSLFLPLLILTACGGGSGPGTTIVPGAPASIDYGAPTITWRTDAPIPSVTPTVAGGTPTAFSIDPALPGTVSFDTATGVVSGTPLAPMPMTAFTITASNAEGSASTTLDAEILWAEFKSIAPKANLTTDDLRYFLNRTHFGYIQSKYDEIVASGLGTYLDGALGAINSTSTMALETAAEAYVDDMQFPDITELALWWLHILQRTDNPLQESIALHWHDHFACSSDVLSDSRARYWFFDHINMWRHNGAGNLRDLTIAMARDWSMLEFLDGRDSRRNSPNENFGREFMELFCLGVDKGYTQDDIVAAAFLFSGYRRVLNGDGTLQIIEWQPNEHNMADRTFLGVLVPGVDAQQQDEYPAVVDITFAHKPAGDTIGYSSRWFVRSILRRYCMEEPAQALVDQLATQLESDNWELAPLFKTLFMSEAFYSQIARTGFIKTPAEHALGFIHATGMTVQIERGNIGFGSESGLDNLLATMDNRPTQPPGVDGWPEGTGWLSAQALVDRANMLEFITASRDFQTSEGFNVASLMPAGTPTAQQVVESLALRLGITLTAPEVTALVDYLGKDNTGAADPFDPSNTAQVEERVRGLLYILGLHPQYMLR